MKVLITGAGGFLGQRLAREIVERGGLADTDGEPHEVDELVLLDIAPLTPPEGGATTVRCLQGDMTDASVIGGALGSDTASVFHLAAVVSAQAEADFDLGMRVNVDGTRTLLEACRGLDTAPRFVATSSVAAFGGDMPDVIEDDTAPFPQSSYGAEKVICELLVNDYSRRGFIDGRVLRLPTIVVRPGKPNAAASSFASGIIREPLAGERAVCPVDPATPMWLMSPAAAVVALIHGHDLATGDLGSNRVVNLPGLTVTVRGMIDSLARIGGEEAAGLVVWEPDPSVAAIVNSWPGTFNPARALELGFSADTSMDEIVRVYMEGDMTKTD